MHNMPYGRRQLRGLPLREAADGLHLLEELSELHDLWQARCRAERLPGRQDFPVAALRRWMGYLCLVDAHPEARFRWRLVGTRIVEMAGRDATGRWFHDLYEGDVLADFQRIYTAVQQRRAPCHYRGDLEFTGTEHLAFDAIVLPLARDGLTVDMMLIGLQFEGSR